ncbi:bifunctional protein-serine/threonine kinase/phosphatase [Immundisolibacter sp.]|uniref:bifunctional protein-serine/threonine kinase/phosphatase n=1 Tax=Immundisolibacter sp. TaxID=1934948 RepID=UPI003565127B
MSRERLSVGVGVASAAGRRPRNEDFAAADRPAGARAGHEFAAALADGVGGGPGGRLAAEVTVRAFLDGYFGLPLTLGAERAAARSLQAINRWLHVQSRQCESLRGMATTFSAVLLRGREGYVLHAGDSRVYRLREAQLQRLTEDHVHPHPDLRHVLRRAVALEDSVRADVSRHALRVHDRFLLCTDGVHGSLGDARIRAALMARQDPQTTAQQVIDAALDAGSRDNVTALVVDILSLPPLDQTGLEAALQALPLLPLPRVDDEVDGFRLLEQIADGRYSRLFRAQDQVEPRQVVLKFPHPRVAGEALYRQAFLREAAVAAQVRSPYVAEVLELAPGRQTRLYSVMPFYRGQTLEQRLRRGPLNLVDGIAVASRLGRAIDALHRRRIVHRDIKPDNVLLLPDGELRLLDLGVARLPGVQVSPDEDIPGTPTYLAPEMFEGNAGDEATDVYALGVTLYRLFTGHFPYGETEAFARPRFGRRQPLAHYRPDLPAWLDAVLARATAVQTTERYAHVADLVADLEHGLSGGAGSAAVPRQPLYSRNPLRFWQGVSLVLLIVLLVVLARQ